MYKALRVAYVLLLVTGVIFGYFWYAFSTHVETVLKALEPDVRVEYAYLRVSPFVGVSIHDVDVHSPHFADSIHIAAVKLDELNTFGLFNIDRSLKRDTLPKSLRLRVQQLTFDLYGDAFRQRRELFSTYHSLGCDDAAAWNLDMLRGMGYRTIRVDGAVDYNFDEFTHRLAAKALVHADKIASFEAEATFAVPRPSALLATLPTLSFITLQQAPPQLVNAEVMLRDDSFNSRKNRLCAQKRGDSVEGFIAEHLRQAPKTMQARGMTFGPGLVEAYRQYITAQDGQVTVTAQPENSLELAEFSSRPPELLLKLMNLAAQVNGEAITNLSVAFHDPILPEPSVVESPAPIEDTQAPLPETTLSDNPRLSAPATRPAENAAPSTTARSTAPPKSLLALPTVKISPELSAESPATRWLTLKTPQNRSLRIPTTELSEYVDQSAIVTLTDGRAHKGKLAAVTRSNLQLGLEIPGGTVGFTIQLDEIEEIRLLP
ncbi:MAG: hypothetical protein V2J55_08995 [Candidatus Competibacteraceae bacterium]|jgi:hypothetical protein|nr:hypothetical protein [Candidatus Competibacteraceae bacterium]